MAGGQLWNKTCKLFAYQRNLCRQTIDLKYFMEACISKFGIFQFALAQLLTINLLMNKDLSVDEYFHCTTTITTSRLSKALMI